MTIVHIGSLPLQVSESGSAHFINELVQQMQSMILHLVSRCLEESLEYENVYWQIPLQRCVFHKLRNIAQALRIPAELDRQAAHTYRTDFVRSAARNGKIHYLRSLGNTLNLGIKITY